MVMQKAGHGWPLNASTIGAFDPAHWPGGTREKRAGARQSRNTIRRTGRLLTPSMPVSNSALPARPPQPS